MDIVAVFRLVFQIHADLTVLGFQRAFRSGETHPRDPGTLQIAVDAFQDRPVFQLHHFHGGTAAAGTVFPHVVQTRHFKPGHGLHPVLQRIDHGADAVGTVEGGRHKIPPVIPQPPGEQVPALGAIVHKVALAFHDRADLAPAVPERRLKVGAHVTVIFRIEIFFAAFLHRFAEGDRFRRSLDRQNFAQHMQTVFQRLNRIPGVFVGVVGNDHRIQRRVLDHV